MFSGPSASRGKSHQEGRLKEKGAKKEVQRATKAQRKHGGLTRGVQYDVEDVGGLYGVGDGDEVKNSRSSRGEKNASALRGKNKKKVGSESEGSEEDDEQDEDKGEDDGTDDDDDDETEQAAAQRSQKQTASFKPPLRASREGGGCDEEDEEIAEIKEELRLQLREWATDPGMPMDEQKRQVRQLLAQWHPDKNLHIASVAKEVFQFIQDEVNKIVEEFSVDSDKVAKKEAEYRQRQAQRAAEKSATAAAVASARAEKNLRKGVDGDDVGKDLRDADEVNGEEFSLVVGHGPATTSHLRPWPRSHYSMTPNLMDSRSGEIFMFGGEAYDGRELTFYSDLYRLNFHGVDPDRPLPWEKLYSSVPMIPGPEARSSHQTVVFDRFLYVFGGEWSSRDQKRYRQFNDLWRFDMGTAVPGARWQRIDAEGTPPVPRSGHRMAASSTGRAVLFGGFCEDRKRRAIYMDDVHVLDFSSHTWEAANAPDRRAPKPGGRSGSLLWATGASMYLYGGVRPKRKGSDQLDILHDLWLGDASDNTVGFSVRWQQLELQGQGPGRRSGLCQCAVSSNDPLRRLIFGGVVDLKIAQSGTAGKSARAGGKEVSLYHNDLFLLDCSSSSADSPVAMWTRLWPAPGEGIPSALSLIEAKDLPPELLSRGGGADAQTLALALASGTSVGAAAAAPTADSKTTAPRGRIAASCTVLDGNMWIFGGSCESGPRQEVTLDDFWRIEIKVDEKGNVSCTQTWDCVLPLSNRALMWFDDSDSDSDEDEDDDEPGLQTNGSAIVKHSLGAGGGTLSKKGQKQEAKQVRMELKRERQAEKCEEKTSKRDDKKEKQRQQAIEAAAKKKSS